jgi:cyclohexadieny/prephenate dehydrogenase
MFKKVCIIGCGLIGSSLARAIKKNNLAEKIVSSNRSELINKKVIELKIVDESSSETKKMVSGSDLVIIATPLSSYEDVIIKIKDSLKNGSVLTDVGSVKENIMKLIEKKIPENISWIPSHPIAGTEESGPEAGFSELFKNRWCILSAEKSISADEISKLEKFWVNLGSKVKLMSFDQHDYVLSLTSHLPHAVAYSIVKTAINDDNKFKNDVIQYSAGGLRDFTRIAASDPLMWRDIFIDNSENILKVLNDYSKNLDEIKTAIEKKDGEKLLKIFSSTKKVRKQIIKAGQDTDKPGFGRK